MCRMSVASHLIPVIVHWHLLWYLPNAVGVAAWLLS
jgi:hypothetical protein